MAGASNSITTHNVLSGVLNADNVISGLVNTAFNPAYALVTQAGAQIVLFINSNDYKMYAQLKDKSGNLIYTSNIIDLPLETMVVDGRYDSNTKKLILVLDNGNEIEVPLGALISGLVNEDDLEANYYDKNEIDTLLEGYWTKIEITQEDIDNWNSKQEYLNQGDGIEISAETTLKGNTSQSLVPSGYTQVDYLHCNAQQYIDTGYTPVQGDNFEFKNVTINYNTLFSAGNGTCQLILLSQDTTPATNYFRYFSNTAQSYISNITNANIRIENGAFYVNNEQVMTSTYDGNVNTNLFIGIRENGQNPFFGNFGEIIITNGTTTKKHYIPCYRNSDNVIGLYDIVNNQFLTNAGTGEFTYGNVLPTPDNPIPVNVVTGDNEVKVEGKNLFDGVLENGTYTSTGVKEATALLYRNKNIISVNPETTYTFSINGTNQKYVVYFYDNTQTFISWSSAFSTGVISTPSNAYYMNFRCFADDYNANFLNLKVQLEEGSTATEYEEHKEQTYPINLGSMELCKIGDYQDYIARSTGKNLFDETYYNNSTLFNLTTNYFVFAKLPDTFKTKFYANMSLKGTNQSLVFGFTDNVNGTLSGGIRVLDNGTINSNVECDFTNAENVYLVVGNRQTVNAERDVPKIFDNYNIMVSKTTALPYEPYGKAWYKYGAIGKVVLDGSENWTKSASMSADGYFGAYTTNYHWGNAGNFVNKNTFIINYFLPNDNITGDFQFISSTGYACYLKINDSIANSVETLQTWLSTHNTTVYYVLNTPTITEITDTTLIEQLDNLSIGLSNKWIKNISQTNAEIPFELEYDNTNLTISANLTDYYTKTETNTLLNEKVGFTDYGTTDTGGVIRDGTTSLGYEIVQTGANVGKLGARILSYTQYQNNLYTNGFIGKGTLNNVLDARIGDIQTLLDNLNTGSGV